MAERTLALLAGLLLLAAAGACRPRGAKEVMEVAPAEAAPGEAAVVRVPGLEPGAKAESVDVEVGGKAATVLRVEAPTEIEFLVPEREAGPAEVAVKIAGREVGRVPFSVLPAPARQLVLSLSEGRVQVVSSRGASGLDRPSREIPVGRGLSYDVVTPEGRLVATGTIPHPLSGRREIFEPEGKMRGAPAPKSATFTLRIPAVPKGSVVRFYEVEPGKDLATPEGRASRRLLSEVEVGG
jgi:hypothetical protein